MLLDRRRCLALQAEDFLTRMVGRFDCWWLTTRDQRSHEGIIRAFYSQLPEGLVRQIGVAEWRTLKTEAIDWSSEWRWVDVDDAPLVSERLEVERRKASVSHGVPDRWGFLPVGVLFGISPIVLLGHWARTTRNT